MEVVSELSRDNLAFCLNNLTPKAGAGKTFLTCHVIEAALNQCYEADRTKAVAYFYCNRNEQRRRDSASILRALARQLAAPIGEERTVNQDLQYVYTQLTLMGTELSLKRTRNLLLDIINSFSETTICLDALDECHEDSQTEILETLGVLMNHSTCTLKIFISSRPSPDILKAFDDEKGRIEITTDLNRPDIRDYINERMARNDRWKDIPEDLVEVVKTTLDERSQGMFQWVALQLRQLDRFKIFTPETIRHRLGTLPESLEAAYSEIYADITRFYPEERRLADRALCWVLGSTYALARRELVAAVTPDPDTDDKCIDSYITEESIMRVCNNFIQVDSELDVWRFCHLSAREYLEKHHFGEAQTAALITKSCLKTLLYHVEPNSGNRIRSQRFDGVSRTNFAPCFSIANLYPVRQQEDHMPCFCCNIPLDWIYHLKKLEGMRQAVDKRLRELVLTFLGSPWKATPQYTAFVRCFEGLFPKFSNCQKNVESLPIAREIYGDKIMARPTSEAIEWRLPWLPGCCEEVPPLVMASFLGLHYLLQSWWEDQGENLDNLAPGMPGLLAIAIAYQHNHLWRELLCLGAKPDVGEGINTPLIAALRNRDEKAIEALLDAGADPNKLCGPTPRSRYDTFPGKVLEYSTEPLFHHTPLSFYASLPARDCDSDRILTLLIDRGAEIEQQKACVHVGHVLCTPIDEAIRTSVLIKPTCGPFDGDEHTKPSPSGMSMVKFLLAAKPTPSHLRYALERSLYHEHPEAAECCIRYGAHMNNVNEGLVLSKGHKALFDHFKKLGADINASTRLGTPLSYAVSSPSNGFNGGVNCVEYILGQGVEINQVFKSHEAKDEYDTALGAATWSGVPQNILPLLEAGADPFPEGSSMPAIFPLVRGEISCAFLSDQTTIEVGLESSFSKARSCLAALIRYGANPNATVVGRVPGGRTTLHNTTPLMVAMDKPFMGSPMNFVLVPELLKGMADPNICNDITSPLIEATCFSDPLLTKALLDSGADPNLTVRGGMGSPLAAAVAQGGLEVCRMLLEAGARVNVRSSGWFPCPLVALRDRPMRLSALKKHGRGGDHQETPRIAELLLRSGAAEDVPIYCSLTAVSHIFLIHGPEAVMRVDCMVKDFPQKAMKSRLLRPSLASCLWNSSLVNPHHAYHLSNIIGFSGGMDVIIVFTLHPHISMNRKSRVRAMLSVKDGRLQRVTHSSTIEAAPRNEFTWTNFIGIDEFKRQSQASDMTGRTMQGPALTFVKILRPHMILVCMTWLLLATLAAQWLRCGLEDLSPVRNSL